VLDFLDAGEPPVYVGFGSMTGRDPQALTDIIVQAVEQSRQRAILQSGWTGMGGEHLPPSIYLLDSAPHNWLFLRMSAIVHHGGAGTTLFPSIHSFERYSPRRAFDPGGFLRYTAGGCRRHLCAVGAERTRDRRCLSPVNGSPGWSGLSSHILYPQRRKHAQDQ